MKQLKIIFDVQHVGKPDKPADRGAIFEVTDREVLKAYNQEVQGIKLVESDLCQQYADIAAHVLTGLGHSAEVINLGSYRQRAEYAYSKRADLYFACHLNSFIPPPKNNYGLFEFTDKAGPVTINFAKALTESFKVRLGNPSYQTRVLTKADRGWGCIGYVRCPAILLEPCFINHPDSLDLLTRQISTISDAIVYAVETFNWP